MSRADLDPLIVMLHADDIREAYRRVMTERRFRWIKQLQWWKDLSEQVEKGRWLVGN
jgi:CTP:molybdopterin cytidylyltransferase MocA